MADRLVRRGAPAAVLVVVLTVAAGCASSVPGTAHAEGEGPDGTTSTSSPGPEPSGRPTVTVQPEGPVIEPSTSSTPGPSTTVPRPIPGPLSSPAPSPTVDAAPTDSPRAAAPTTSPRPRATTGGTTGPRTRTGFPSTPSVEPQPLTADVLADECLLDAAGVTALIGAPLIGPAESTVIRPDGSRTRSCYAVGRGAPAPGVAVNVYRVNRGTPAEFVRSAAGGRPLPGVGQAAILLDTVGGTTLQVATNRYLVTVSVVDIAPSDARWRAAGLAVVAAADRR